MVSSWTAPSRRSIAWHPAAAALSADEALRAQRHQPDIVGGQGQLRCLGREGRPQYASLAGAYDISPAPVAGGRAGAAGTGRANPGLLSTSRRRCGSPAPAARRRSTLPRARPEQPPGGPDDQAQAADQEASHDDGDRHPRNGPAVKRLGRLVAAGTGLGESAALLADAGHGARTRLVCHAFCSPRVRGPRRCGRRDPHHCGEAARVTATGPRVCGPRSLRWRRCARRCAARLAFTRDSPTMAVESAVPAGCRGGRLPAVRARAAIPFTARFARSATRSASHHRQGHASG